jgi:hypothetical protein
MSKKTYSNPHPNSLYSKLMASKDKKKLEEFNRWRREILDDTASMRKWARDGCVSTTMGDRSDITRDDLTFYEDED